MGSSNKHIRLYSCFSIFEKKTLNKKEWKMQLDLAKEAVAFSLLQLVLMELTTVYTPHFYFEDDGKMGWLDDTFERIRLTRMFPFLCNNKPIPSPIFIRKSKNEKFIAGIELADTLCFSTARTIHNMLKSQPIDLDIKQFGEIGYITFDKDNNATLVHQKSFPKLNLNYL